MTDTLTSDLSTTESTTPDTSSTDGSTPTTQTQTDPSPQGQFVDVDTLDRYRYKGQSLKDWESGYMRHSDYTQKTQALAEERKYYENLAFDLDKVRTNHSLAEQFRQIYPEKFHPYLRYILENSAGSQPQTRQAQGQPGQQSARMDPSLEMRINNIERSFREKEVSAIQAELDQKFKGLQSKYPYADEEAVIARAQALLAKMKEADPLNPNLKITDKQWDVLWKGQHDRAYQLADQNYKKQVQAQVQANKKGAESGKGGGIPGQAPRQYKTIKEATAQALADIELGSV